MAVKGSDYSALILPRASGEPKTNRSAKPPNPFRSMPGAPFDSAQKQAAEKVRRIIASQPASRSENKNTTRKITQANREGQARVEAAARAQEERGNRRLGLPSGFRGALPEKAHAAPERKEGFSVPLLGTINLGPKLAAIAPGLAGNTPETAFVRNALKDVHDIGELPFVGTVAAGKAAVAGVQGNFKPAGELAKGVAEGVAHGAIGELAQGHFAGAERAIREHPVFSATEVAGLESVAGRTAGSLARGAGSTAEGSGLRGALARAGSVVRPPLALTDEAALARRGYVKERSYSKDPVRKAAQVAADRRRKPVLDAEGNVATIKDRGRTLPVLQSSPREQERFQAKRANFEAARTQGVEHLERAKAQKIANEIEGRIPRPMRHGEELSQLVASGTIRSIQTFRSDLQKRIRTIEDAIEHPERYRTEGTKVNPGELRAAKANLKLLRSTLNNKRIHNRIPQIVQNGIRYAEALNKGDKRLGELHVHPPEELERAALSEYALAHMGAKHAEVDGEAALRSPKGDVLTNEAIQQHMARHGRTPKTVAYVPHTIAAGRKGAFHVPFRPGGRPVAPGHTRTGALYNRGATAIGTDLLREELIKKGVTANNAQAIDKFVGESGLKRPDGQFFNAQEALETARRLNSDGRSDYMPVRAFAAKLDAKTKQELAGAQSPAAMETAHHALLNDRIIHSPDGSKERNVVLVPKRHIDVLLAHLKPADELAKVSQPATNAFRKAVLPLSSKWLVGNALEPYLVRLPLSGAGVNLPGSAVDFAAATKIVKGMERSGDANIARAGLEIRGAQLGGMLIGRKGATVRRSWEDYTGNAARAMYGAHIVRNLPAIKQFATLANGIPEAVFAVNRLVESTAQKIAFGKQAREDIQAFTGSWLKSITLGKKALAEVQKGLVDTPTQQRFMERQWELLGKYDGFSPRTRRVIQSYSPFLPWYLNSLRFVYWTLPMHHSAAFTGLVKGAQKVQAEWEAQHSFLSPQQREGSLADAVVRKDGGLVDVARFTPWGATVPLVRGDFGSLPDVVLPQLSGSFAALRGQDPFGRELQVPKTDSNPEGKPTGGQKVAAAVNSLAEAMVPGLSVGRRLREGGGTAYANSTILSPKTKSGSSHESAASRTLNPFRPVYIKARKGSNAFKTSLGGSLGSNSLGSSLK